MSLSTTFSEAADLLRRNVYALLMIGAIVFVPSGLVLALIDDTRGWGDASFARSAAFILVFLLPWALAFGAAIAAIAVEPEGAEERPRTPLLALRDGAARFPALLALTVVFGAGVLAGLVLLIVPGLILLTWWFVAYQPAVIDSTGVRASLGRSRSLVRGSFWPVLALAITACVATAAFDYVVYRIAEASLPDLPAAWLAGIVADTVVVAVSAAVTTAAYWQLSGHERNIPASGDDSPMPGAPLPTPEGG